MEAEGVPDPGCTFNELVDEYGGTDAARDGPRERGSNEPTDRRDA
jgi:hypothetical protein